MHPERLQATDSLSAAKIQIADSLDAANKKELKKIEQPTPIVVKTDTVPPPVQDLNKKLFVPNPTKATWLAVVFPGGGQIYNRKYWKLPIIYGGFAGCAYALSWNGKMYKDYSQAYLDIMDSNPNTKSYEDLLPPNAQYNEEHSVVFGTLVYLHLSEYTLFLSLTLMSMQNYPTSIYHRT